ncbi:response regulator [Pseudobacter ginsenosidimutans]|uniref:Response regulator receiver domain-containing protein n=1 Tax=Pseudobacter ginsenosidimutans TaxID=661488 RepID=A0A4Q7N2W0_9BACT|nr:response regulator transcription factor [Pseudobacter ginsenosidimutans]QEC43175.1 response regulator transcription factor [Pseudobacter ginsenosidimutans]RZS74535.1 response regulator receiver domain-containing protein [Pseudobacter ginsenosidimutans]
MNRILIADSQFPVRIGLRSLVETALGDCIVDFARNGQELFALVHQHVYALLITDLNMPLADPAELIPTILSLQPELKILVFSVNSKTELGLLESGVSGYLHKEASDQEIMNTIRIVYNSDGYTNNNKEP